MSRLTLSAAMTTAVRVAEATIAQVWQETPTVRGLRLKLVSLQLNTFVPTRLNGEFQSGPILSSTATLCKTAANWAAKLRQHGVQFTFPFAHAIAFMLTGQKLDHEFSTSIRVWTRGNAMNPSWMLGSVSCRSTQLPLAFSQGSGWTSMVRA